MSTIDRPVRYRGTHRRRWPDWTVAQWYSAAVLAILTLVRSGGQS